MRHFNIWSAIGRKPHTIFDDRALARFTCRAAMLPSTIKSDSTCTRRMGCLRN
jgi:hypothetical protein